MKNKSIKSWLVALSLMIAPLMTQAEETTGEKIENKAGDIKTDAKKTGRKVRREARKATGQDSVIKDAKDKVHDASDDVSNAAKKAKNKVD